MLKLCGLQFLLVIHSAMCLNLGDLHVTGPLKDMNFSIPEGGGVRILYQFTSEPPAVKFRLSGDTDGIIGIAPENGILYLNGSLDWETKPVHWLQVESLDANGNVVEGPYAVTIYVEDINDNPPEFDQITYSGVVRQNSRPGKPFMYVHATDRDNPATPHAQLTYSILHHFPNPYKEMLFQIDNVTGAISPSRTGSYYLDPQKQDTFTLVVSVKDMAGMSTNAFTSSADVIIHVKESLWKAPPTIRIQENSTQVHPVNISQVQSNEPNVTYDIFEKEEVSRLPFSISQDGVIYVTKPLDREEKDTYTFFVITKDNQGELVDKPLQIHVIVEDINDNPPVCKQALTVIEVQENEVGGSNIGTLFATDMDEENTLNSRLRFKIKSQVPEVPTSNLFYTQQETGILQLTGRSLSKLYASNYSLEVLVTDGAFETICDVEVHVIDINDQIPIFEKSDYHNVTIAESVPVGTVILEIQAHDGDEPATGSSLIIYQVKEGDPNNTFIIDTDAKTNRGFIKINKALDFETKPVYNLVINATNPEPLVPGVQYNSSSLTLFKVFLTNVDEPPVFLKPVYKEEVSEDIPVNTLVMTVEAYDPEGDSVRYSLEGDVKKWLRINPTTGQVYTASRLDREETETYTIDVVATELNNAAQKSRTSLILHLQDVNDNLPYLVKDNPAFFCYPVRGGERTLIQATDADEQWFYSKFTFSLADDINTRNNWEISKVNATHAYLSPKHPNFEEKIYNVPIILNDNGKPALENKVHLKVNICKCSSENSCFIEVEREHSWPTAGQAIGILIAVLLIIGAILGGAFFHMKYKQKNEKSHHKDATDSAELNRLT
ncbi:cadherin-17 [Chiroxiphia lanceolata]|uniref:cadherin-17 n=1 Tax=Chiroxiphia lanceolata TaxID=296741 RepID=UPI0013CE9652|nr:cadherin-17 [Chiroxiphia lanceolata]XP_032531609.1 cadherin-17 [Chiroxiphia lanceolata]XP_032531618.1 cadherin-17 [Chiroxiphia lanceolata]XP_032531625.1 cadherin-17 [Chiroxiphia lanceolata]XP_032531633.1 cadherin-17 [Chiroxiphia lanceolata]